MKLQTQEFEGFLTVHHLRQQRLLSYVFLWEKARYWQHHKEQKHTHDIARWSRVIRSSDYAYSTTHISWLTEHRLEPPCSEENSENNSHSLPAYLAIGTRIAWRKHEDQKWFLTIEPSRYSNNLTELMDICRQNFRVVIERGNKIYLSSRINHSFHDDASELCIVAASATTDEEIMNIWKKACALECELAFVEMLPDWKKNILSKALTRELEIGAEHLSLEHDIDSELFSRNTNKSRHELDHYFNRKHPAGRLGDLLHANRILDFHFPITASDSYERDYYNVAASSVILASKARTVSALLHSLPPGRTLLHAISRITDYFPWVLVSLASDTKSPSEGIFGLLDLTPFIYLPELHGCPSDVTEEHNKIQEILRWHIIGSHHPYYANEAITLGLYDEWKNSWQKSRKNNVAFHNVSAINKVDLFASWDYSLNLDPGPAEFFIETMQAHLRMPARITTTDIIFAIRLLKKTQTESLRRRLLETIVDLYIHLIELEDSAVKSLHQFHDQLIQFAQIICEPQNIDLWQKWVSPCDSIALDLSKTGPLSSSSGKVEVARKYSLQNKLSTHLRILSAQLPGLNDKAVQLVVNKIMAIYEMEKREQPRWGLFSWNSDLIKRNDSTEPVLVLLGKYISKLEPQQKLNLLTLFRSFGPTALEQAQLLWGGKHDDAISKELRRDVSEKVEVELQQDQFVGYLWELLGALYYSDSFTETTKCAKVFLSVVEKHKIESTYKANILELLMAALVAQGNYAEAIALNSPKYAGDLGLLCRLHNLTAIASLYLQQFSQAQIHLDEVLKLNPNDQMALSNYTALHLWRRDWQQTIEAAKHARSLLSDSLPSSVVQNEILAFWELGEREKAAALLAQLPQEAGSNPDILKVRTAMLLSAVAHKSELDEHLRLLEKTQPALASELRMQLDSVAQQHLFKLSTLVGLPQRRISLEDKLGQPPELFLSRKFAERCLTLVERPDFNSLDEDQLTTLLAWLSHSLIGLGIQMRLHPTGGHGVSKQGVADFLIEEKSFDPTEMPKCLVRGEAKKWDGAVYFEKGIRQVFGTSNTYQEIFLSVVVYYLGSNFSECVNAVKQSLESFSFKENNDVLYKSITTSEIPEYKSSVRVYRSVHRVSENEPSLYPDRILYTYLLDLSTAPAKAVRGRKGVKSPAKAVRGRKGVKSS